jgi:hypothetical protein
MIDGHSITAALAAIRQLIVMSATIPDLALRWAKLGPANLGRVDHDQHTVTLCETLTEPEIASEVLLYQLLRLDHGPGRDEHALRATLQQLVPPEEQPPTPARVEEIAAHLGVSIEAIHAALG